MTLFLWHTIDLKKQEYPLEAKFLWEQVSVSDVPKRLVPHVLEDAKSLKIGIARQFQALYLCKKLKKQTLFVINASAERRHKGSDIGDCQAAIREERLFQDFHARNSGIVECWCREYL